MKSAVISSLCVVVASLGVMLSSQTAGSQDEKPTSPENKINSLMVERRDTLRQLVDSVTAQYKAGRTTLDNVIRARNGLLDAELEIAKTKTERIRIHEERVKNFRDLENAIKQRYTVGKGTHEEMLTAKAARLKSEIEFLRE